MTTNVFLFVLFSMTFRYWSDTKEHTIRRSKIDGSFIELVAQGDRVGRVLGMALSDNGQSLYVTDENTNALLRLNVSNVHGDPVTGEYGALATSYPRELLLDRLHHPRGLALDEQHRKVGGGGDQNS